MLYNYLGHKRCHRPGEWARNSNVVRSTGCTCRHPLISTLISQKVYRRLHSWLEDCCYTWPGAVHSFNLGPGPIIYVWRSLSSPVTVQALWCACSKVRTLLLLVSLVSIADYHLCYQWRVADWSVYQATRRCQWTELRNHFTVIALTNTELSIRSQEKLLTSTLFSIKTATSCVSNS